MAKRMTEIRCSQYRRKKSGKEVRCGRFLAEISDYQIVLRCSNCGHRYIITRKPAISGFDVKSLPDGSHLLKTKGEQSG